MIASVVETRGAERFRLVAEALQDEELKQFYKTLWISEAKHGHIFVKMALRYFDETEVYERLAYITKEEAGILNDLVIQPTLH